MVPPTRALELAGEHITYAEEKDEHILRVFGIRYKYEDQLTALQARERLITMLANAMVGYAAEVQALNSWLPTPTTQN